VVAGGAVRARHHDRRHDRRRGCIVVKLVERWLGLIALSRSRIGPWAFTAVAVCSLGGPLALAALAAPTGISDVAASAGLVMVAAAVVFAVPLVIWLHYSRHVTSAGGLYAFVEAAAGRRVALGQAALWTISYLLYVVYTTVQIVYDLLPSVIPGERRYQTALALLIPLGLVAVMVAGRRVTLAVLAVVAVGQLALAGVLDGVTVANIATPASSFSAGGAVGPVAKATAQTSLLYVCASLPLFLGGEVRAPARTIRRGLIAAYAVTALVVILAVAPLAAAPGLTHTSVPGVSVAAQFAGQGLADAIGIGVAVSIAGVILCEYLALTRLLHAISSWPVPGVAFALGLVFVAVAPLTLIDPQGFYTALLRPSLAALWLSQLIVFAVYPRFARRTGRRMAPALTLSVIASGLAGYGFWVALTQSGS
jgi:amino acid transporter